MAIELNVYTCLCVVSVLVLLFIIYDTSQLKSFIKHKLHKLHENIHALNERVAVLEAEHKLLSHKDKYNFETFKTIETQNELLKSRIKSLTS